MTPYVEGIRHYHITPESHGAKVLAAAYIMMCQTILSVAARAGIKLSTARTWSWDDTVVAIASVFALGHTGAMVSSYNNGMGEKVSAGGSQHLSGLEKSIYASNILYIAAVVFAKLSILLFIRRLTPSRLAARICWTSIVLITLWGSSAILVSLFACGLPRPWQYDADTCINLTAFTRAVAIIDMLSDLFLVALPLHLFARNNYSASARWTIITVFSMRAFILVPSILRFITVPAAFNMGPGGDASWFAVPFLTWESVVVHYSVISASIPCVRPFLRSLESGLYDVSLKVHPRLARTSDDVEKNFTLMTLSGWSVRKGVERLNGGSSSISTNGTQKQPLRASKLMAHGDNNPRTDSPELERQQSISSEAEFSRKLHPEVAEYRTRIQSMRTYPQFGKFATVAGPAARALSKKSGDSNRWEDGIAVTKETRIRFEREGVVLQELSTRLSNH